MAAARIAGPEISLMLLLVLSAFEALAPIPAAASGFDARLASLHRLFELSQGTPTVAEATQPAVLPEAYHRGADAVTFAIPDEPRPHSMERMSNCRGAPSVGSTVPAARGIDAH